MSAASNPEKQNSEISETESEPEEVVVIPAKTDLLQRAVTTGSPNTAYQKAIKAAEDAIEQLSVEFEDWMVTEIDRLSTCITNIRQNEWNEQAADELFTISHDIKGQATTLGYPIITEICETLCQLLEKAPQPTRISLNVIETFVQSIRTILDQCERNETNPKANAISLGLKQMTIKILKHEIELAEKSSS